MFETTATAAFGIGSLVSNGGVVITALGAVIGTALAFKLGPRAVAWGIGKIKLGR